MAEEMTEMEKILVQISELVFTEIRGIKNVTHDKARNQFEILTDDGKRYIIEIKEQ